MVSSNPLATAHPGAGTSFAIDGTNEVIPLSITNASIAVGTIAAASLAANSITSAQIDTALIQGAVVTLSSAQILALSATPVTIVAAPGAGKTIVIYDVLFRMVASATAYASGGAVSLQYHTGPIAATSTVAAAVVNAGSAGTKDNVMIPVAAASITQNDAVEITNATGAFTTGTGTASVHIRYYIR